MADIGFKSVGFTCPSGGSFPRDATFTLSGGPGKTPKAVAVFVAGGVTLDTIAEQARLSIGFTDGTTQRSIGYMAEDGAAFGSADAAYRIDTATVIQMPTTSGPGLSFEASFVSFGTDSVTLNFSAGSSLLGEIWFFYGADLQANVTSFVSGSTIGSTASTTAPGFKPDAVFACSVNQAFVADGNGAGGMVSFGFSGRLNSITQACSAIVAEDKAVTAGATSVGTITRDDAFVTSLTSTAGVVAESTRIEMTSYDTNGFTITTRNVSLGMEAMYLSLKLGGAQCWAGAPTVASSSTGTKNVTTPNFRPQAMFASAAIVTATNTVGSARGALSIAMGTATEAGLVSVDDRDGLATSDSHSVVSSANVVDLILTSSTHDWIANLIGFTSTGFDLNVSDASAADRPTAMFAIEQFLVVTGDETVGITETSRLIHSTLQNAETVGITEATQLTFNTLQLAETEAITEAALFVFPTLQLSETEGITEAVSLIHSSLQLSETVGITEAVILIQSSLQQGETEGITETALFVYSSIQNGETVSITETSVFVLAAGATNIALVANETVSILEAVLFLANLRADETVGILDSVVFNGTGVAVIANETVGITESVFLIPGRLLTTSDTETILDGFSFGNGPIAIRASPGKAVTLQAGVEMAATIGGGTVQGGAP